ncbi:MAG: serine/threonine protein kinase [Myxococcota bacterium]
MSDAALDRYVLEGELGHGGMSVVHRARDTKLPRRVAVKVLHDFLARQQEARHRFHREAVAVARLEHRAILAIYDYSGPEAAKSFIVTELIDGPTLREFVDRHDPFPWPEMAMLVVSELAEALDHAHKAGVLHRDIKPENIMIQRDGQLKLMDFGIAQIVGGATQLTATGALIGSPAHMPPEVIDGRPADQRADIFSLGTILYWLTTGRLPFEGPHPSALFRLILEGDYPRPEQVNPKVGRQCSKILSKCLHPDPHERFETAALLRSALLDELELVGLVPPEPMVRNLLTDPEGFREAHVHPMLDRLLQAGTEAFELRHYGKAADLFNRVLGHEPNHPEALAYAERIARGRNQVRRLKQLGWTSAILGMVALSAGLGTQLWNERPLEAAPPPASPPTPSDGPSSETPASDRPTSPATPPKDVPLETNRGDTLPPAAEREPVREEGKSTQARTQPRPTPARERRPSPPEAKDPIRAQLVIQIGRGYADIYVNGVLTADLAFRGTAQLEPGTHTVQVVRNREKILERLGLDAAPLDRPFPLFGRFEPRTVEVDSEGQLFERHASGRTKLPSGILRFLIPMTEDEAERIEDWISS